MATARRRWKSVVPLHPVVATSFSAQMHFHAWKADGFTSLAKVERGFRNYRHHNGLGTKHSRESKPTQLPVLSISPNVIDDKVSRNRLGFPVFLATYYIESNFPKILSSPFIWKSHRSVPHQPLIYDFCRENARQHICSTYQFKWHFSAFLEATSSCRSLACRRKLSWNFISGASDLKTPWTRDWHLRRL